MLLRPLLERKFSDLSEAEFRDLRLTHGISRGRVYCGSHLNLENKDLDSLEGMNFEVLNGGMNLNGNRLVSFKGAPKRITGDVLARSNRFYDLHDIHLDIHQLKGTLDLRNNPISSHVLGLLLIKDLDSIGDVRTYSDRYKWIKIVDKHLPNKKGKIGMFECQEELLDAGLENFAEV